MIKGKSLSDTAVFTEMVARKHGWKLNPDEEFTTSLREGLTVNWNRYGYFLCPCRDSEGTREADADAVCPCAYSSADIAEYGHCYCSLYCSDAFLASGAAPRSIPERRPARD